MARRLDEGKLLQWQELLARFESSGLSVAAYCRQQKIAPAQFYYWMRRVREVNAANANSVEPAAETTRADSTDACWAEVVVDDSILVRLPQDPQLICAVVGRLQTRTDSSSRAFERIDLVRAR